MAGPLFNSAQVAWNRDLAIMLRRHHEVINPQEYECDQPDRIAKKCLEACDWCDLIFINCDGSDVDSGTAFEAGYCIRQNKWAVAYRTDFRRGGDCLSETNLMIAKTCHHFILKPLASHVQIAKELDEWLALSSAVS